MKTREKDKYEVKEVNAIQNTEDSMKTGRKRKSTTGSVLANLAGRSLLAVAVFALVTATAEANVIVDDWSNFIESGTLLGGDNDREVDFEPSGTDVIVDWAGTGSGAGQEMYTSSEFPKYDTAGMRLQVDIDKLTSLSGDSSESAGLAVASSTDPGSRENLLLAQTSVSPDEDGYLFVVQSFDADGKNNQDKKAYSEDLADSVWMEKTSTGWDAGYTHGGTETTFGSYSGTVEGVDITADGSAVGLWTDMRGDDSEWTVTNLSVVPEPSSLLLLLCGGLLWFVRRRVRA